MKDKTDNKKAKELIETAMSDNPDLSELLKDVKPNSAAQLIWPDVEMKYGPEDYYDADRKDKKQ